MKNIFIIIIAITFCNCALAQDNSTSKIGWFLNPEVGGIFHADNFGKTLGGTIGLKFFNNHLKVGWQMYGSPGPINSKEYVITPSNGQLYKGQSTIAIRSDYGAAGLFIAPMFNIKKIRLEFPVTIGQMGAGFYLTGDDRKTPDGERVSVWEDKLMDGRDAGFSTLYEVGSRVFFPLPHDNITIGLGLHYIMAPDWETYTDPTGDIYQNRFRIVLVLGFESSK